MKKIIGYGMSFIGAHLWEKGGFWNESERYEDLTMTGKLGYNMLCTGLKMMGASFNDNQIVINQ